MHFRLVRIAGGHLFPFERPEAAALAVGEMAGELLPSTAELHPEYVPLRKA
jgi:hypothetical protein